MSGFLGAWYIKIFCIFRQKRVRDACARGSPARGFFLGPLSAVVVMSLFFSAGLKGSPREEERQYNFNDPPLIRAIDSSQPGTVQELLKREDIDVNQKSVTTKDTAVEVVATYGGEAALSILELLLKVPEIEVSKKAVEMAKKRAEVAISTNDSEEKKAQTMNIYKRLLVFFKRQQGSQPS